MADEINTQDMKQSQTRIVTASKAILAVVAVTAVSSVAISKYNSGVSNNTGDDTHSGGSAYHMPSHNAQEVSSNAQSDTSNKSLQITQTIQQLNQVSNSLSQESIDIFNSFYKDEQRSQSSRRRLSMSENEGKLLRGLSAKQSTPTKVSSPTQKISLYDISQQQQHRDRKLGRGVGMKRPKGHNMLQNMDNKWHTSSSSNSHSEDTNMLQRYSSPSWDTWYSNMDAEWGSSNWNMGGGKSGKSGHWEYHPSHDEERYWDHPPPPSWNMNDWGNGKSGKSGYKYQGWGHEVPVVGWEHHPSYGNWWGHNSSSSEDSEEEDTYSTSEVDSETEEVDVTFSASSVAEEDPDDRNAEPEEEAAASSEGEEDEDGIVISYGYCGIDAEEASRRCKKPCTQSSDCKEDKQCFASPSCDPDAVAKGKMNRNGDQFEE